MKVCLITNAHISYNPRLLKEADALHQAGHEVRVVSVTNRPERVEDDEKILASRSWRCDRLNFDKDTPGGKGPWLVSGLRTRVFHRLSRFTHGCGFAEKAFARYLPESFRAAVSEPADLYIAHNLQALPVAAQAAKIVGARLGFDVEDFHIDEDSYELADPHEQGLKRHIMEKYIGGCTHLSAPSEAMADALVEVFDIPRPVVLYNVFPLSYGEGVFPPSSRTGQQAKRGGERRYTAYWFSHVVSLDRGLQDFIRAMPLLRHRIDLYLRGGIHGSAREKLLELAGDCGVGERIHFLPPIHAEDLVRDAANYDFGLALEQPVSKNRMITVTNKIFTYVLAGMAVIATDTPGQREVMEQIPGSGILYRPGNHEELAVRLSEMLADGQTLTAKNIAWEAGRKRFNWDVEKGKFLASIEAKPGKG